MTRHTSFQDFEEDFEVFVGSGGVDHGEGAGAQGVVDFAAVIAVGSLSFDDDGGWRLIKACEDVQES